VRGSSWTVVTVVPSTVGGGVVPGSRGPGMKIPPVPPTSVVVDRTVVDVELELEDEDEELLELEDEEELVDDDEVVDGFDVSMQKETWLMSWPLAVVRPSSPKDSAAAALGA
jgi:hypothetical protein